MLDNTKHAVVNIRVQTFLWGSSAHMVHLFIN